MNRLKNAAVAFAGLVIAVATFAFFASLGLAVVGLLAFLALFGGLVAVIASLNTPKSKTVDV